MLTSAELIDEGDQVSRLGEVLPGWLSRVPLYQGPGYSLAADEESSRPGEWLSRLPFITKSDLRRDFPRNFLSDGADLDTLLEQDVLEVEHTSGTSEERTPLLMGRGWWKAQEDGALRRNAFAAKILDENPVARRVTINSPVCNNDIRYTSLPTHAERVVGNALFVNQSRHPFLWSEEDLARMAAETLEWDPVFLDVDPVYGALFAQYCERRKIRLPSLRFILCSYEFVSIVHRRILQRAFGVPILNLYGSTETGHLMMESEHGEMMPSLETAFLEVVETDAKGIGELVVTTLTNDFMPLIRYRIGDLVEKHGQPHQITYVVHGRARDAFLTSSGRRVTTLEIDQCFADLTGITHYQLWQTGEAWRLRFTPERSGPDAMNLAELQERLARKLEIAQDVLEIEPTDLLMPEGSGKFLLGYPRSASRD